MTPDDPKEFIVYAVKGDSPNVTGIFETAEEAHDFVRVWIGDDEKEHRRVVRWIVREEK